MIVWLDLQLQSSLSSTQISVKVIARIRYLEIKVKFHEVLTSTVFYLFFNFSMKSIC